jgi:5,6,7,8-tetrahydromethanopterin hydro-lyase
VTGSKFYSLSPIPNALSDQKRRRRNPLAVMAPSIAVKPSTVMITKVTIKGAKQAVQMFGPAQKAVAEAVADCVKSGVIPKDQCDSLVIVCGVLIHWQAKDDKKSMSTTTLSPRNRLNVP